jgi:RimJ/RimL family protein N-acetyltransferase
VPFELQPTLSGDLVELRPLRAEDFDALYAVAADPLIWEQHPERERYREEVFRRFFREAMESGGAFLILDRSSGQVVGSTRYFGYDPRQSEIEIGWTFLARSHWGGRYNGEMKRLMLEHAFQFVEHVVFLVGPRNFRSRKAVEKIGGVERGTRIANGRESIVYEITADRFNSREEPEQRAKPQRTTRE